MIRLVFVMISLVCSASLKPVSLDVLAFKSLYLSSSPITMLNSCFDMCPSLQALEIKALMEINMLFPYVSVSLTLILAS